MQRFPVILLLLTCFVAALHAAPRTKSDRTNGWKAGAAKVVINPTNSIWLTGFAARTNVSRGKLHDLYAKALALQDESGGKSVLITSDLLGFPGEVSDRIAIQIKRRFRIPRERIVFNSSHTHGAPALASANHFIYGPQATPKQWKDIEQYTKELEGKVVGVVGNALKNMEDAQLTYGEGTADFGVNRRLLTPSGLKGFTPNPAGPVDRSVPVLRVENRKGELLAVVFGYGAHPTTITGGPHYYDLSGDYAGFAQELLEEEYPGAVALFVQGCGGDVMVSPRGTLELAQEYGSELKSAVTAVLRSELRPVRGPLGAAYDTVEVDFAPPPGRAKLEEQLVKGDLYERWHAREMLQKMEKRILPQNYPYPIQVWRLGNDLTFVALAGEVVAEYSLNLKRTLTGATWVAGYSNDLLAYIPSERVLAEGGYEGGGAMIYYMQPAPFAPGIEKKILEKTHELVTEAGRN